VECSGFAGRNQCYFGGERLSVELQNSASGPDGIEGQTVKMPIRKFILESAWILLLLLHPGVVHAVTPVTIFIDMETGNPSDLFTIEVASRCTYGLQGRWENGRTAVTLMTIASQVNAPPRDTIRVGSTDFPDTGTRSLRKQVKEGEFNTVVFTSPPRVASVGFFIYFSSEGDGWTPGASEFRDFFALAGTDWLNYLVLSVVEGGAGSTAQNPILLQIHTGNRTLTPSPLDGSMRGCNSGLRLALVPEDKWIWAALLYDIDNNLARMQFYDPANQWNPLGYPGQCPLDYAGQSPSAVTPLHDIKVGQSDAHGTPQINSAYYLDDIMVDTSPNARANYPLLPRASSDQKPPAPPTGLRVKP